MRRDPLRIVLFQESVIDWHHEHIAVRSYEAVCDRGKPSVFWNQELKYVRFAFLDTSVMT